MKVRVVLFFGIVFSLLYFASCNKNEPKPPVNYSHPCPGMATVIYEGKTYQTIQIGNQCWLRENLDVGIMVNSISDTIDHSNVSDNGIIEKYCYENLPSNCEKYGGLYDWSEMMKYSTTEKTQGICPPGFHIPSYDEIDTLVNLLGGNLTAGAQLHSGNRLGFDLLFDGDRDQLGGFFGENHFANIWSSTPENAVDAYCSFIEKDSSYVSITGQRRVAGHNVRCIKN